MGQRMDPEHFRAGVERQLVWDMFPHYDITETFCELGLVPASRDVTMREHADSDQRIMQVAPLWEAIDQLAGIAGGILSKALTAGMDSEELPDEIRATIHDTYDSALKASARGIIGQLLARRLLTREE